VTRLSIEQLGAAPELAVLVVLEAAADNAVLALATAYPELEDVEHPDDSTPATREALSVVEHARALGVALARYRRALLREQLRDDLMHF